MRAAVLLGLVLSAAVGAPQTRPRPDFSGTWTLVTGNADRPLGSTGTIAQTATAITFTDANRPERAVTLRLDAPETRYTSTTVRSDTWTHVAQVRWVTNALLVTTATEAGVTGRWEDAMICSLADGNLTLVLISTPKSAHLEMITRVLTYKRAAR